VGENGDRKGDISHGYIRLDGKGMIPKKPATEKPRRGKLLGKEPSRPITIPNSPEWKKGEI